MVERTQRAQDEIRHAVQDTHVTGSLRRVAMFVALTGLVFLLEGRVGRVSVAFLVLTVLATVWGLLSYGTASILVTYYLSHLDDNPDLLDRVAKGLRDLPRPQRSAVALRRLLVDGGVNLD